jgi:hypothetical protein
MNKSERIEIEGVRGLVNEPVRMRLTGFPERTDYGEGAPRPITCECLRLARKVRLPRNRQREAGSAHTSSLKGSRLIIR